jgi:autotransporter-associated beta strand protein
MPPLSQARCVFVLSVLVVAAAVGPARAQTYTWDPTLSGTAAGGGSGTWNTTTANWFNGTTDVVWPGAGQIAVFGGTLSGTVTIATGGITADGLTVNTAGYTIAGNTLTLTGSGTLTVAPSLSATISAPIAGSVGLTKAGTGTLVLSGASTYTGLTTVGAGILNVQNATALGVADGTAANGVTVASGATLQLQGGITVGNKPLTLSGTGFTGQNGALVNLSGTNTYGGLITLGSAAAISSDAGTLNLTNTGTITGSGLTLTLTGAGNGTLAGAIGTGTGGLIKSGVGTWTLSGANTYTGDTVITRGTLSITGSLASTSNLTFNGTGAFNVTAAAAGGTQSLGTLSFLGGTGTVTSTYGTSGNASLTFAAVAARPAGATGNFVVTGGTNGTTNAIVLTGQATGLIDQGTFFGGSNYAFYDAAGFVRAPVYGTDTGFVTATAGTSISDAPHVLVNGAQTAQTDATFTTLKIGGAFGITQNAGSTITVNGILKTGANATISGGNIRPGPNAELIVRADVIADALTINSPILANGTNAFTKTGAGSLTLGTAAINTHTGGTFINQGTLIVAQDSNFGDATALNPVTLNGGTLQPSAAFSLNANHPIVIGPGGGAVNSTGTAITLGTANLLQGSGPLTITGGGQTQSAFVISASQSGFSGPITISSGRIQMTVGNATNPLGTGDITINGVAGATGGSLFTSTNGGNTYNNRFIINGPGAESRGAIRNASGATLAGPIVLTANATLSPDNNNTTQLISGNISGPFTLTLNGTASATATTRTTLTGTNSFSALVFADIVNINSDAALGIPAGPITFNNTHNAVTIGTLQAGAANVTLNPLRVITLSATAGTHVFDTNGNNLMIAGVIAGGITTDTVSASGGGTLTFQGNNSFASAVSVAANTTLSIQNGNALGTTAAGTTVVSGGSLQLQGGITTPAEALTLNGTGGVGGTGALRNISGNNTFAGLVTLASDTRINSDAGSLTLSNTGTIGGSGFNLSVGGAGNTAIASVIGTGTGGLTKDGTGTLTLSGANTYSGTTTVNAGTVRLAPSLPFTAAGGYVVGSGAGLSVVNPAGTSTLTVPTLSLGSTGSTLRFELNTSTVPTAALLTVGNTDGLALNGGTHTVNVSDPQTLASGSTFTLIAYSGAPITSGFTIGSLPTPRTTGALDFSTPGQIKLTITGIDTLIWAGNQSADWDVGSAVNVGGTMNWKLTSNGAATNFVTGDVVKFDDSASAFTVNVTTAVQPASVTVNNATNTYTFSGPGSIAGSTVLTKQGAGTLILLTNNTYTGGTTVSAGTLQVGNGGTTGALGPGDLAVSSPGTVVFNRSDDITFGGNVSGTGSLTKLGTNILTLTGTYTLGGTTTITGGTLALSSGSNFTAGGVFTGAGGLLKGGAGTLTLTGNNTYSGPTTLSAGQLNLNSATAIGTGNFVTLAGTTIDNTSGSAITLTNNNTQSWNGDFTFAGTNALNLGTGAVTLNSTRQVTTTAGNLTVGGAIGDGGNNFGLTKAGAGTLTLTGASTYGGTTSLAAGTLALAGGNNRLPATGTLAFTGSATLDVGSTSQTLATFTVPDQAAITSAIAGTGGTLVVNGTAADLEIGPANPAGATTLVTLSMANLSNFTYNSPTRAFRVGMKATNNATINQAQNATVTLAANNTITAALFAVADQGGARDPGLYTLHLGQANTINTTNVNVGFSGRSGATLDFATGLTNPTVTLRGLDGTSAINSFNVGQVANNRNTVWTDAVDFSAGSIDAIVTSMTVGSADTGTQAGRQGTVNANFTMGAGTLTVGSLTIGRMANTGGNGTTTGTVGGTYVANGTFTINNPAGTLNATTITLADNTITDTGTQTKTLSGTLALTDGTVKATTIQRGATTGTATASLSLNWAGGTLQNTDGANLSVSGVPVVLSTTAAHTFNVTGTNTTTLDATSVISGGATSGLTKAGPGTLVLAAANTYTGPTAVTGGTILVNGNQSAATGAVGIGAATLGGTGTVGGLVTVNLGGTIRGGTPASPTAALTTAAGVTLVGAATNGGALAVDFGGQTTPSGNPAVGTLAVTGGTLNLSTASGPIQIKLLNDGAGVLQPGVPFTITLATAPTPADPTVSTSFQLNGTTITTNGTNPTVIGAGNYTLTSASFTSFSNVSLAVGAAGDTLVLTATPAPEPATVLGLAAAGLGLGGFLRRRLCRSA